MSAPPVERIAMTDLEQAMQTLAYFSLFQYPLTTEEWISRGGLKPETMQVLIQKAANAGLAKQISGFWLISGANTAWIDKRIAGNRMAEKALETAATVGKTIFQFPFVQAVCVSGSLSKQYFDPDADIDFFIITSEGRLWLARTLMVAYKRVVLKGSHKHFCVNYFVSDSGLAIPDENIFVATEIATLLPVVGLGPYQKFLSANQWYRRFMPNCPAYSTPLVEAKPGTMRKITEFFLRGFLGNLLDGWCFRMTVRQWKKRFPHIRDEDFDLNLRSRKAVSKHHPRGFQKTVLDRLAICMKEIRHKIELLEAGS